MNLHQIVIRSLPWLSAAALVGCSGSGGGGGSADPSALRVVSTSPARDATDIGTGTTISATFSSPVSTGMPPGSVTIDGIDGTVSVRGSTVTFTPATGLSPSRTYTARVSAGVTDTAGAALAADYVWSFTTARRRGLQLPFEAGNTWIYDHEYTNTVVATSTGVHRVTYSGRRIVHVVETDVTWEGRSAALVEMLDLEDGGGLQASQAYVSHGSNGLELWKTTSSGGEWRRVLSYDSSSFSDNTFWMAGGPAHRAPFRMDAADVAVPAGSFSTLAAVHSFKSTGAFAPEDIFEDRVEYYAEGVGLVAATWDYSFDDNDPRGTDLTARGQIQLTHFNSGPLPLLLREPVGNDGTASAAELDGFSIVSGQAHIDDAGTVVNGAQVHANKNGAKLLQDWYRLEHAGGPLRIDLFYESITNRMVNDLDFYVFRREVRGTLTYVDAGLEPAAKPEAVEFANLPAGTYFIAVQAWDTPSTAPRYWLSSES